MNHFPSSQELRNKFFAYFKKQHHSHVPSSPVVPGDDPTLLFTNAGMNQFKDLFLGKAKRGYTRAVSSQKCIRAGGKHNDLDNVGHTARHLTFFEMLGNFSFGDYFKREAIQFAYEVTTQVFEFDIDKLWVTVFREDDEAFGMWEEYIAAGKLLPGRILRMDEDQNFWSMGETGPCGPCTELYYDRGAAYGDATSPANDLQGDRYIEFWNLVFMQFERDASGSMTPLPKPSIDTGAGLERVMALKMGVNSVFETDVLRGLIARVEQLSGISYNDASEHTRAAFRVIADHIRSLSFAIADGAIPSNIDRGYVLRKILRRAFRHGKLHLGLNTPFLAKVYPTLVELMGNDFPELASKSAYICEILTAEESGFIRTLERGGSILNEVIAGSKGQISGANAFKLKDTYGLPLEEIMLIAKDAALTVNLEEFYLLEESAKERSRGAMARHKQMMESGIFAGIAEKNGPTLFNGYEEFEDNVGIVAIFRDGERVSSLAAGEEGQICITRTPFYAEKGGQVADTGTFVKDDEPESLFNVTGVTESHGIYLHTGKLEYGTLLETDQLFVKIDKARRRKIENNHTATHLLHYALCKVVGDHIKQEGSLVEPERLRFDFSHHKPLTADELRTIEKMVNEKIRENTEVSWHQLPIEAVQGRGDIKQFFGDKYGNIVRLVEIDFSRELCGGTHTSRLGTIGLFRILKEGSIASGVRRIEAITGFAAESFMYAQENLLIEASEKVKVAPPKLLEKLDSLLAHTQELKTEVKTLFAIKLRSDVAEMVHQMEQIGQYKLLTLEVDLNAEQMAELAALLLQKEEKLVLILANKTEGECSLLVATSEQLAKSGINANEITREIAPKISGKGGGKPTLARAGGTNSAGIGEAFKAARAWLKARS